MSLTCAQFREQAAAYVLGGLDAEEQAAAEAHLQEPQHDGCLEALREASLGTEALARSLVPVRPAPEVWQRLAAQLETRPGMGVRERVAWLLAVAGVLFALAGLSARRAWQEREGALTLSAQVLDRQREECRKELGSLQGEAKAQQEALSLLSSPGTRVVTLQPQPGKPPYAARALVDVAQRRAMLLSSTLPAQAGKDYQLWILRGQAAPAPAGLLRPGRSGTVLASIDPQLLALGAPDALAVSVEPFGGSPSGKPSGDIVLVGTLSGG